MNPSKKRKRKSDANIDSTQKPRGENKKKSRRTRDGDCLKMFQKKFNDKERRAEGNTNTNNTNAADCDDVERWKKGKKGERIKRKCTGETLNPKP